MSEYPSSCVKCGKWTYIHASEWASHYVCEDCYKQYAREQEIKKNE